MTCNSKLIDYADDVNIMGERVRTIEKRLQTLKSYLKDTGADGRIILRWILRKWDVGH
jgi:hypothetical protein